MAIKLSEKYQLLPSMNEDQFEALKADIQERGVLTPIDVDEDGFILDGHHRYRACVELGITDFPTIIRLDLSEDEKRMFARKSNMLRRHLTQEQMRIIIASQLKDTPDWANNRIAQELGVDSKTVQTVRETLEATLEIPKFDKLIGLDGKARPVRQPRKPSIMVANEAEYKEVLDKVAHEVAALTGQGFLSVKQGQQIIVDKCYDPMFGLNEVEIEEWKLYYDWIGGNNGNRGGATFQVEWLRRNGWRTPSEWIGEEGGQFRAIYKMKNFTKKAKNDWAKLIEKLPKQQNGATSEGRPSEVQARTGKCTTMVHLKTCRKGT